MKSSQINKVHTNDGILMNTKKLKETIIKAANGIFGKNKVS